MQLSASHRGAKRRCRQLRPSTSRIFRPFRVIRDPPILAGVAHRGLPPVGMAAGEFRSLPYDYITHFNVSFFSFAFFAEGSDLS